MKQILDVKYILFNNGSLNHAVVQVEFPGTAGLSHNLIYHVHDIKLTVL